MPGKMRNVRGEKYVFCFKKIFQKIRKIGKNPKIGLITILGKRGDVEIMREIKEEGTMITRANEEEGTMIMRANKEDRNMRRGDRNGRIRVFCRNAMRTAGAAVLMSTMITSNVLAAGWQLGTGTNTGRWWYDNGDGTYPRSTWQWLDGNRDGIAECYYFGSDGWMYAGGKTPDNYDVNADGAWMQDGKVQVKHAGASQAVGGGTGWKQMAGRWYYDNGDGTRKTNCWAWLDGNRDGVAECYCFDADGWMYAGGKTPDGYDVNADGAWTKDGVVQVQKYGGKRSVSVSSSGGSGISHGPGISGNSGGSGSSGGSSIVMGSGSSGSHGNAGSHGNSGISGDEQAEAQQEVVDQFLETYICDDMSDYEKELQIIQYLVENVEYDKSYYSNSIPSVSYSAYGALVLDKAVCSGYARAFQVLAEACGLETDYVSGTAEGPRGWAGHAWNRVCLDGDWYNVDVTWEDPVSSSNDYGFGNLRNRYINLTDEQLSVDHRWSDKTPACDGTEYGQAATRYYFLTGDLRSDLDNDDVRAYVMRNCTEKEAKKMLLNYGYRMDDDSNYFGAGGNQQEVSDYLQSWFADGGTAAYLVGDDDADFSWISSGWLQSIVGGDSWRIVSSFVISDADGHADIRKLYLTGGTLSIAGQDSDVEPEIATASNARRSAE